MVADVVGVEVGVEETEADTVVVAEAEIQATVVVEVGAEEITVAVVVVVVEISEEVAEILEVEEAVTEASTVVVVEGVAGAVVLGNREGTWSFLSMFLSNLI